MNQQNPESERLRKPHSSPVKYHLSAYQPIIGLSASHWTVGHTQGSAELRWAPLSSALPGRVAGHQLKDQDAQGPPVHRLRRGGRGEWWSSGYQTENHGKDIGKPWVFIWEIPELNAGWWYTYPSEKYEFVSWDDDIPNIWKKKCSEPPTS